jgi:ribosomal protein S18 acetylase RimI-like enzyme
MDISIKPLSPKLINDYLFFFDNIVFSENPDWDKCYCYSFHFTGTKAQWNKKQNRASVVNLIREGAMKGYLAYSDGTPIGWCNANDRIKYQGLQSIYRIDDPSLNKICSIVCFLIHPDFRKKGIAGMLLGQVIHDYSINQYDYLEGYPAKEAFSCEKNYKGPLRLYKKNGFEVIREENHYYVVRKVLT